MSYLKTTAYQKIKNLQKRIRIAQGGTAAGKTIGILMYLAVKALTDKQPTLASVVSESFPHLKRGAIRDFLNILEAQEAYEETRWNKTDYVYTFPTGSKVEFFSVDQPGKVRGPRRQRLFGNECNNWSFEIFEQLEVRTSEFVFLDYNPVSEFWIEDVLKRDDAERIILTYKDNEALEKSIVDSIEQRMSRPDWWKVYGEGQFGEIMGKIFSNWQIIDEIPHEARLERYGLDFGYTNDPTAIVAIYYYNGSYILDEITYQNGLLNDAIAGILKNLPPKLAIADSAEPKSIDTIKTYGISILPAKKGRDSVRYGIGVMQDQQISVTKRSVNLIKEYRNYLWQVDKNGKILDEPEKGNDHAIDAARYAICSLIPIIRKQEARRNLYQFPPKLQTNPI